MPRNNFRRLMVGLNWADESEENLSFRVRHARAAEHVKLGPAERPPPLVTARSRLMTSGESITHRLRRVGPEARGRGVMTA